MSLHNQYWSKTQKIAQIDIFKQRMGNKSRSLVLQFLIRKKKMVLNVTKNRPEKNKTSFFCLQ